MKRLSLAKLHESKHFITLFRRFPKVTALVCCLTISLFGVYGFLYFKEKKGREIENLILKQIEKHTNCNTSLRITLKELTGFQWDLVYIDHQRHGYTLFRFHDRNRPKNFLNEIFFDDSIYIPLWIDENYVENSPAGKWYTPEDSLLLETECTVKGNHAIKMTKLRCIDVL